VPVVALDEYVDEHNMPLPDLIKLDVQGFELEALVGAKRCVASARFIIVEVSLVELYLWQALFRDIYDFCRTHGFRLYALGAETRLGKELLQADALFLREGCVP